MHILHSAKRCFLLLSLFAASAIFRVSPLFAQSDWYYGKPIKKIVFEGLDNIKQSDLTGVTSNFIGEEFSDEVFSDLLNRVFALNYFDEVNPQAVGDSSHSYVIIKLSVVEFPIVSKIKFTGNSKVRVSELKNNISCKEKDIYSEEKRLNDEKALLDLYTGKGFSEIKV
ncbi:MAG TPA: outer membrane protein assembly factor BamA, partial [Treponema sp.]|nr:outer membrane protein assembly factor BamA [Treponema sp.]